MPEEDKQPKQIPVIDKSAEKAIIDLTVPTPVIPASGPFGRAEYIQEKEGAK